MTFYLQSMHLTCLHWFPDSSVSTISTNLIKKRKKSGEEEGSGDAADAKKAKADSAEASSTNGTAKEESAK